MKALKCTQARMNHVVAERRAQNFLSWSVAPAIDRSFNWRERAVLYLEEEKRISPFIAVVHTAQIITIRTPDKSRFDKFYYFHIQPYTPEEVEVFDSNRFDLVPLPDNSTYVTLISHPSDPRSEKFHRGKEKQFECLIKNHTCRRYFKRKTFDITIIPNGQFVFSWQYEGPS